MTCSELESYFTTIFSSDRTHPITKLFLANSPNILMGSLDANNSPHFIVLLQPPEDIISLLFSQTAVELPFESPVPFVPAEDAALALSYNPAPYSPPSPPPPVIVFDNFRDYVWYTFGQDTHSAIYSVEGGTRKKLWQGIRNHRAAYAVLKQAGFIDLRSLTENVFQLPNGTRLPLSGILHSELQWDLETFKRKYRNYEWCTTYAASHCWDSHQLPAPGEDSTSYLLSYLFSTALFYSRPISLWNSPAYPVDGAAFSVENLEGYNCNVPSRRICLFRRPPCC